MDSLQTLVLTAPAAGEQPRDGALLHGRYRLLERLGAGGFGVVWRAQDEQLHREVALKRIPLPPAASSSPDGCDELQAGERASREALAAARLAHPAIVALYEAYVDDDAFYLVSELVHGDTLAALIAANECSDEELLQIGLALAQALLHAHARGVVHRDVKPQNVLVPDDRDVREAPAKLTDFGGASLTGEDALTRTGETLGTLAYMAPEQSEGREVGEPADLYSLALVLYEGLTGANPVRGPTPAATARRIGRQLPPLATRRPDLPRTLVSALDTALAVDPDCRGTLDELCVILEQVLAQGLTRRRGLFGARTARVRSQPDMADWPAATDVPDAHAAVPAAAEHRTVLDRRALAPRRSVPAHRSDPADRLAWDDGVAPQDSVYAPSDSTMRTQRRRFPLPRAVWIGCVLAAAVWLVAGARPGAALLLLAAAAPLLLLGPRPGIGWLTATLAPLLGLAGLAGAYPALAGQAPSWSRRATLGALGYWWLTLAEPLLAGAASGGRLWLGPAAGLPARAVWEGSLDSAATHVIGPVLSTGVLFGMLLWALGAAVLPWLVRGSSAVLDTIAAVVWSAALIAAAPYFDAGLSADTPLPHPRGAVIGGILAAAIAIAARALRGPVGPRHP
ncbi:MAG: protein kinase domain-containing protein [Solirubrobacteraceae bacterium]